MADALSKFDFSSFGGTGLFVKFEAGKPITLRVLTVDPVVANNEYEDPKTGDITLTTKFNFVVYNFTDSKAQILSASPTIARKIGELHTDPDFGADIKKIDIKITPTGEKLQRRYDIQVLPKTNELSSEQISECRAINLDEKVKNGTRMSLYDPTKYQPSVDQSELSGYDKAKAVADSLREDVPITDIGDEPIDLSDIPF